jgi:hypothetical protein
MSLTTLDLYRSSVTDLSPLKGMPLTSLDVAFSQVPDLSPLAGMPLTSLCLQYCAQVRDLAPLEGLKLKRLFIYGTGVTDLTPLQGMPLEEIRLTPENITRGLDVLQNMKSLKTIGISGLPGQFWPAAKFWEIERKRRLPALLRGEVKLTDNKERLIFARLAHDDKKYAFATRLWAEALASDPKLGDDRRSLHRYHAARAAVLAVAGQGKGEPQPNDAARAKLRGQALRWLEAEVSAWAKLLASGPPQARPTIVQTLSRWHKDSALAGIRDRALASLPAEEQRAFTRLWADVAALLKASQEKPN